MLKNLVTIVTGGARGLGKGSVEMFLEQGAKVVLCDLPKSEGADIAKALGSDVLFVPADTTSESDVQNVLSTTKKNFGKLDVLVNCRIELVQERMIDLKLMPKLDFFAESIRVNTVGTFNMIRLAVGLMMENEMDENQQRGVIINSVHSTAYDGNVGESAMAASSAAIVGMTKPMAREFAGIRVVNIATAAMETDYYLNKTEKLRHSYASDNIWPTRLGRPDEFAHMVKIIVENSMLNDQTIRLDAGNRSYI